MKSWQIVLIEDNPADVLLVKLALKESGIDHDLIEFTNGVDAVEALCGANGPDRMVPDAILLDLNTPRTDGFDALSRLRKCFQHVPVTILTSSRARADKHRAALQGVSYLEKASELPDFLASVGRAVKEMLNGDSR